MMPSGTGYESQDRGLVRLMILAVDLDGCIIAYGGKWVGPDHFGPLIKDAQRALQMLHEAGHTIVINTCRYPTPALREYLTANNIPFDYINEEPPNTYQDQYVREGKANGGKKVHADLYIDDRGFRFEGDWVAVLDFISSKRHIPWEERKSV